MSTRFQIVGRWQRLYKSRGAREHEDRTTPPVAGPEQDSGALAAVWRDQWMSFWLSDMMGQSQVWNQAVSAATGTHGGFTSSYTPSSTDALQSKPGQQTTALWTHLKVTLLR